MTAWIVLATFGTVIVLGTAWLCRQFQLAPHACDRCQRPTDIEELEAGAGYCRDCLAVK